jgi:hypothetical protein
MKSTILIFIFLTISLFAQDSVQEKMFSNINFNISVGPNFNTIPTAGTSINFALTTNIISNLNAKFSLGYSILYNNDSYQTKSYGYSDVINKYYTQLFAIDRIKYTIIPINIGAEYNLFEGNLFPFIEFMLGYNISSSLSEGRSFQNIVGMYDRVIDIPIEYRKLPQPLDDGSSFTAGIGIGVKYKIASRMDLNFRYIYHYNKAILNYNQLLFGFTF